MSINPKEYILEANRPSFRPGLPCGNDSGWLRSHIVLELVISYEREGVNDGLETLARRGFGGLLSSPNRGGSRIDKWPRTIRSGGPSAGSRTIGCWDGRARTAMAQC